MKAEDVDYLCSECADKLGWRWPEGHAATFHMGICDVCGFRKSLSCWNDWLRPGEDKIAPENWD